MLRDLLENPTPNFVNTVKLELPSISSVHARGPVDTWYNSQYNPKPAVTNERLPTLSQIQSQPHSQPQPSGSSTSSSPRGGSISSGSASVANSSTSSNTSYAPSVNGHIPGYKTPSPEQTPQAASRPGQPLNVQSQQGSPYGNQQSYGYPSEGYNSMNQMQSYADVHPSHMSAATAHAPASAAPSSLAHYSYPQQSSILQPGPQYPPPAGYPQYGYGNGVPSQLPASSSMSNAMVPQSIQLPAMSAGAPASSLPGSQSYPPQQFDHTGQIAPAGMKPRVTATLWEDEGSLCFQVEAKGVCVARREDNHMINGTKLLNVAGMTRGRRDGILKSEKTRHVVKIGPMHLKGVWIPFERALEFANKEKITESLYPLFVHDIGALLYHPSNQTRASVGGAAMAAVDRNRRPDPMQTTRYLTGPTTSQPPSLHHHHSMSNPIGAASMSQPPHAIQPHPSSGRPGMERAHTFPTPPTSASSIMGMNNQGSFNEWSGTNVQNIPGPPLSIDTGLSNARSGPTTPASTPPGTVQAGMSYPTAQSYDSSRPMYSAPPSQPAQYNTHSQQMMGYRPQDGTYPKTEMAPPARAPDQGDVKPAEGMMPQTSEQVSHASGEVEGEHENEYTHTNAPYNSSRASYGYSSAPAPGPIHGDHPHLSPEMTGSPHQNGSGRATPRTTGTGQAQWNSGYPTPQRQAPPSSNLYNVMSDTRGATNGNAAPESYPPPGGVPQYPSQAYAPSNGIPTSAKRGRDDDEQDPYRPDSVQGDNIEGPKRRKTMDGGAVGSPYGNPNPGLQRTQSTIQQRARR
ncbi:apses-domain-containing protein [Aaosphaeria arxii CBS 175.79]|uniref:Apses-domain-containing protein n=1 Tax=Aaosphaeria arxii CBS 175.79 TaxID=1450172 RepID=A0A6A5XHU0_9PLEO|nr:apses-domain-containing protein [Aaosphaeria arxii CBS 175.79]KAF2011884.1 apses-domain-containing protein [Aaosphaeria arxii CBS 175.79]